MLARMHSSLSEMPTRPSRAGRNNQSPPDADAKIDALTEKVDRLTTILTTFLSGIKTVSAGGERPPAPEEVSLPSIEEVEAVAKG